MTRYELAWSRLNGQQHPKKDGIRGELLDVIQRASRRTEPTSLTTMGPLEANKWMSSNDRSGHEAAPANGQRSMNMDCNWLLWRLVPTDSELSRGFCLDTIESCYGRRSKHGAPHGVERLVAAVDGERAA